MVRIVAAVQLFLRNAAVGMMVLRQCALHHARLIRPPLRASPAVLHLHRLVPPLRVVVVAVAAVVEPRPLPATVGAVAAEVPVVAVVAVAAAEVPVVAEAADRVVVATKPTFRFLA